MDFSKVVSVSGKGGLFKVIKPTRTGVLLESLDKKKQRMVAGTMRKVSALSDIAIYTTSEKESAPLKKVLKKIYAEFADDLGVSSTSQPGELKAFLKHILSDYDESRVYVSDIKKMINWYAVLLREAPQLLQQEETETPGESADEPESE